MTARANLLRPQPNPPIWRVNEAGEGSVFVLGPEDVEPNNPSQIYLNLLEQSQGELLTTEGHFSNKRIAVLLKPGLYPNLDFRVGCKS